MKLYRIKKNDNNIDFKTLALKSFWRGLYREKASPLCGSQLPILINICQKLWQSPRRATSRTAEIPAAFQQMCRELAMHMKKEELMFPCHS